MLSRSELAAIYNAAQKMSRPYRFICLFLIHVPLRKSEVALMRWSDITDELIIIPATNRKNKVQLVLPNLIGENLKVVPRTSEYVFPSSSGTVFSAWSKNKHQLDRVRASTTGCSTISAERSHRCALSMSSRTRSPLSASWVTYPDRWSDRAGLQPPQYLPQMRAALVKWEEYLSALLAAQ